MRRTWNTTDIQSIVLSFQFAPYETKTYRVEDVDVRNLAIVLVERLLKELGDQLTPEQKAEIIETELTKLRAVIKVPEVKKRTRADKYI